MVNGANNPDDYRNAVKREKQKRLVAETIWLQYLNDCFLKAGLITPHMHRQMRLTIDTREQQLKKTR